MINSFPLADTTAVVLSGGTGQRFAEVGRALPKPLLPINAVDTLLTRNLRWLLLGGFANVIVSTSPDQHEVMTWAVERFLATITLERSTRIPTIRVLSNAEHALGPVAALARAISTIGDDTVLYCLGDICFLGNPFSGTTVNSTCTLFARNCAMLKDLSQGGIALVRKQECRRLCLHQEDCLQEPDEEKFLWSGMALLDQCALQELQNLVSRFPRAVEEDYINHCIRAGQRFEQRDIPRFVNVNTFEDYRVAVALVAGVGTSI